MLDENCKYGDCTGLPGAVELERGGPWSGTCHDHWRWLGAVQCPAEANVRENMRLDGSDNRQARWCSMLLQRAAALSG